jgi:aspartate aminotransferase-like enzyme
MIYDDYTIFTPGPVKMSKEILDIGAKQTPYFRNSEFSKVVLRSEELLLKMLNAPDGSRVIFLTASGTAGMESTIMNLLTSKNNALVVNGGGFGQRFIDLCKSYKIPHNNLQVYNTNLSNIENEIDATDFDTFIVNAHETSIGHLYNLSAIGNFCKKHNLFNIVDAISMFTTDEIDMQKHYIDTIIISSQKGLALPPGLTMVVLNPRALAKVQDIHSHYFNFKNYLKDGERGQTPYTPAVTIILQLLTRLEQIERDGGVSSTIKKATEMAKYFRKEIQNLPLKSYTPFMPNAMTTLTPIDEKSAIQIVEALEKDYKIIVCPNGGKLKDTIFRISHMGDMDKPYLDLLINALKQYYGKKNV